MKILSILLLFCGSLFAHIDEGEYIITKSQHGWFRKGFYEKVEKNMMIEDTFPQQVKVSEYIYKMEFYKNAEGKPCVSMTMSKPLIEADLAWGSVTIRGVVTKTKSGFYITLEDGKEIHFMNWKHFEV